MAEVPFNILQQTFSITFKPKGIYLWTRKVSVMLDRVVQLKLLLPSSRKKDLGKLSRSRADAN